MDSEVSLSPFVRSKRTCDGHIGEFPPSLLMSGVSQALDSPVPYTTSALIFVGIFSGEGGFSSLSLSKFIPRLRVFSRG